MVESKTAQQQLGNIIQPIFDRDLPTYCVGKEVDELTEFLSQRATFQFDRDRDIAAGETETEGGLAISPTQAAMCAAESVRTSAFLRGLEDAIVHSRERISDRPTRVLYAGCGPYALLAVPIMARHLAETVEFTLLDIHRESLDSAKSIIQHLDLASHVAGYACEDACRYRLPAADLPDIILSETMFYCLQNEPLVAIARNLLGQAPAADLIPQRVDIDACLIDPGKEFRFVQPEDEELPSPDRDRIHLGNVFELSDKTIKQWAGVDGSLLPASTVKIPREFEKRYEAYLRTTVTVLGDVVMADYDCSLTIPRPIVTPTRISGGELLKFRYRLGSRPGLEVDVV